MKTVSKLADTRGIADEARRAVAAITSGTEAFRIARLNVVAVLTAGVVRASIRPTQPWIDIIALTLAPDHYGEASCGT
jgi:hypothetical protein